MAPSTEYGAEGALVLVVVDSQNIAKKILVLDGCFLTPDSDFGCKLTWSLAPSARP